MKGHLFDNALVQFLQVINSVISFQEELGDRVFVLMHMQHHAFCKFRVAHGNHEVVLCPQSSHCAIVLALDCCRTATVQHSSYLSEHASSLEIAYVVRLGSVECFVHFAFSSAKEEHLFRKFALNADLFIWLVEIERQLLKNVVCDLLILPEHVLLFHHFIEFMSDHLSLDTWGEKLHEA